MKLRKHISLIILVMLFFMAVIVVWSHQSAQSFKCPNGYADPDEYIDALAQWTQREMNKKPNISVEDLLIQRDKELIANGCESSKWLGSSVGL